jgi:hopanoid biosynthesis associated RND transporter like protein HpnN
MKTTILFVVRTVRFCTAYARAIIVASILVTVASSWYAATHFAMTTDINRLTSSSVPWRQHLDKFEKVFPQFFDRIVAVIDAPTLELADDATSALINNLASQKDIFRSIQDPKGGSFFAQNGFLFEGLDQLKVQLSRLTKAQRLIAVLAGDPSLRGALKALQFGLLGVQSSQITLDSMTWPMMLAAETVEIVNEDRQASFSWYALTRGRLPAPEEVRRFIIIQAALDYSALEPAKRATEAIRHAADSLQLAPNYQARVRLTGPAPMADEEFATIKENAGINAALTVVVVLVILWFALRWLRVIFAVSVTLVVGLAVTAAAGMLMVGTLNLISVYFAVLFVGLGVDFGIQFSVRYRAERHELDELRAALLRAANRVGAPLTLAALATAAGFLAFLPTDYRGFSELGLIAGVGMLIAFLTSITLLPALLSRLNPPTEPHQLGFSALAPVDRFLQNHRLPILIATGLLIAAALPLLYWLQFDFNPMNLRSKNVESVATYLDLKQDSSNGVDDIGVLAPSLAVADELATRLRDLPEVSRVTTLTTFIPDQQQQKLATIAETARALDPALNPKATMETPTDGAIIAALTSTADELSRLSADATGQGADAARRLAAALTALANADQSIRGLAAAAFILPLRSALDRLRTLLTAKEITRENLPSDLVSQWLAPDGQTRIDIAPKGDTKDNRVLQRFADSVLAAAPGATEGPIPLLGARRTIIIAFIEASGCALFSIVLILWIMLRRITDVLLTLFPLLLAAIVTLEICVVAGVPLNFANIIALPLLLGVGVAFKIYYIIAWREGQTNLLQSVLTRAVVFSALTTATAFGSLWFSSHPGTSSMGKLLAISLLTTMAAATLFQPILMGKPRDQETTVR